MKLVMTCALDVTSSRLIRTIHHSDGVCFKSNQGAYTQGRRFWVRRS